MLIYNGPSPLDNIPCGWVHGDQIDDDGFVDLDSFLELFRVSS